MKRLSRRCFLLPSLALFVLSFSMGTRAEGADKVKDAAPTVSHYDPNAVIGRDYRMTVVVTDGGRVITGIVREENSQTLTLQTANDLVLVPKDEIDVRKQSPVSMMPEGMLQKMKPEEVRDLLKYLASEGQVPLPPG